MVYNTQNYWVFGLCPLSVVLKSREHNVSETGFVGVFHSPEDGNRSSFQKMDEVQRPNNYE
jgi:hypothetical protein